MGWLNPQQWEGNPKICGNIFQVTRSTSFFSCFNASISHITSYNNPNGMLLSGWVYRILIRCASLGCSCSERRWRFQGGGVAAGNQDPGFGVSSPAPAGKTGTHPETGNRRQLRAWTSPKQQFIWRFPEIGGTPKSSILIGFSIMNHPFWDSP